MSISFVASATGAGNGLSLPVTVPAQVRPGDIVLAFVTIDQAGETLGASSSGRTAPARVGPQQSGPATCWALYQFSANLGDAGAVLTFTSSVSSAFVGLVLVYRGAGLVTAAGLQGWTAPAGLTAVSAQFTPPAAGSWGLAFGGVNSASAPSYSSGTLRAIDGFTVSALYDSGAPQSPVGGGTWTTGGADVWWGFTAALPPAAAASAGMLPVFVPAVT